MYHSLVNSSTKKNYFKKNLTKTCGQGNDRPGKCPFGEMSVRGNVRRGSVRRESVSRGIVLDEVSVGELSSRGTVRIPLRFYELCKSR